MNEETQKALLKIFDEVINIAKSYLEKLMKKEGKK
jgi:hypothetical protein